MTHKTDDSVLFLLPLLATPLTCLLTGLTLYMHGLTHPNEFHQKSLAFSLQSCSAWNSCSMSCSDAAQGSDIFAIYQSIRVAKAKQLQIPTEGIYKINNSCRKPVSIFLMIQEATSTESPAKAGHW